MPHFGVIRIWCRWSRTWRLTTWLPLRKLWLSMRAFSKDLPPITYLSDCPSIYSPISNNIPRKDINLQVFLEYEEELGVRGKNVKEKISEFFGIVQVCWNNNMFHKRSFTRQNFAEVKWGDVACKHPAWWWCLFWGRKGNCWQGVGNAIQMWVWVKSSICEIKVWGGKQLAFGMQLWDYWCFVYRNGFLWLQYLGIGDCLHFWCFHLQVRLVELHSKLRTSCIFADKMSSTHKVFVY